VRGIPRTVGRKNGSQGKWWRKLESGSGSWIVDGGQRSEARQIKQKDGRRVAGVEGMEGQRSRPRVIKRGEKKAIESKQVGCGDVISRSKQIL